MAEAWDIVLLLLSKGADPNKARRDEDGRLRTPLFYAAWFGNTKVCKCLLAKGARKDLDGGGEVLLIQHQHNPHIQLTVP